MIQVHLKCQVFVNVHNNEFNLISEDDPQNDAGQRNYVCGWVLTKCLKNICKSCLQCRQTLLESEKKITTKFILKKGNMRIKAVYAIPA